MSAERSPGDRHWDPAAELTGGSGLLFWSLVAIALCVTSWGPLWQSVRGGLSLRAGGWRFVPDFFQDYASARNYYNRLDVYFVAAFFAPSSSCFPPTETLDAPHGVEGSRALVG